MIIQELWVVLLNPSFTTRLVFCTRVGRGQTESDSALIAGRIAQREFDILCALNFDLKVQLAFDMLPQLRPHFWNRLIRFIKTGRQHLQEGRDVLERKLSHRRMHPIQAQEARSHRSISGRKQIGGRFTIWILRRSQQEKERSYSFSRPSPGTEELFRVEHDSRKHQNNSWKSGKISPRFGKESPNRPKGRISQRFF